LFAPHDIEIIEAEWTILPDCAPRGCDRFVAIKLDSLHKLPIRALVLGRRR
jgi:hypothetical protein